MTDQLNKILDRLQAGGGIALAFSGGMDSAALLELCLRRGVDVLALHFTGPHLDSNHFRETVARLEARNIPHRILNCNPLEIAEVRENHPRRCYFCKLRAFGLLRSEAGGRTLCDGTNAGDLTGYRPGLQALAELGIHSPFAEAGLAKADIRALAESLGIALPPSGGQNCLLTRFAYGLTATEQQLRGIENAEAQARPLLHPLNFRLRYLSGGRSELHVESSAPLSADLLDRLSAVLPGTPVVVMEKLSGFFDRTDN